MKKRFGILTLAAAMLVQTVSFVPTFAADTEDTVTLPVPESYTVSKTYKDATSVSTAGATPWGLSVKIGGSWHTATEGTTASNIYNGTTKTFKVGEATAAAGQDCVFGWAGNDEYPGKIVYISAAGTGTYGETPMFVEKEEEGGVFTMSPGSYNSDVALAKVFTAPESGIIRIGSDFKYKSSNTELEDNVNVIAHVMTNKVVDGVINPNGAYIKVSTSEGNVLMPQKQFKVNLSEDNTEYTIPDGFFTAKAKNNNTVLATNFETCYKVKEGEKIYFEVGALEANIPSWQSLVNWTPVVDYIQDGPTYELIASDANGATIKVVGADDVSMDDVFVEKLSLTETNKDGDPAFIDDVEDFEATYEDGIVSITFDNALELGYKYRITLDVVTYTDMFGTSDQTSSAVLYFNLKAPEKAKNEYQANINVWGNNDPNWKAYSRQWGGDYGTWDLKNVEIADNAYVILGRNTGSVYTGWTLATKSYLEDQKRTDGNGNTYNPNGGYFINNMIMATGSGNGSNKGWKVAKGYTAPYTGTVKIEQNNTLNSTYANEIWSSKANSDGIKLTINKNSKSNKVWPLDKEALVMGISSCYYYEFEPITVDVKKGDILYFDVNPVKESWSNENSNFVHWNPKVTYTSIATDMSFTNAEGTALTASTLFSATDAKLVIKGFDAAESVNAVPVVAFYNDDNKLVKAVMGETIAMDQYLDANDSVKSYTVSLGDISTTGATSVKVMLWSADGSIAPLTNVIGQM